MEEKKKKKMMTMRIKRCIVRQRFLKVVNDQRSMKQNEYKGKN